MNNNFYIKKINSKSNNKSQIKKLFKDSFPKNQIVPLWYLLLKAKKPNIDFLAFYDVDKFIGFTYLLYHNDITYILYLAIDSNNRSKGYGSKALELIKNIRKDSKIFLSIDYLDINLSDYKIRKKRKEFYIRNGFIDSNIQTSLGKDKSETMSFNCHVNKNWYLDCVQYLFPIFCVKLLMSIGFLKIS